MPYHRLPFWPRSRKSKLAILVGAVALPAIVLAAIAVYLTLRVSRTVDAEASRYDQYLGEKVSEAFNRQLSEQMHELLAEADAVARRGGDADEMRAALVAGSRVFEAPQYLPMEDLADCLLLTVEGRALLYGEDPTGARQHPFVAHLVRGADDQVSGAAGWWFNPRSYLSTQLQYLLNDRMPSLPLLYGGLESTRQRSISVLDQGGHVIARLREPMSPEAGRTVPMVGPFAGYQVRIAPTSSSPIAVTSRLVVVEVVLIVLLTLVMLGATFIGIRYIMRQIELVNAKTSFVSNVTHELKTPVAVIKVAAETIELGRFRTDAERDKYLRTIIRETDRLAQLVDNILDLSRLEAGQHRLHRVPLEVRDIVQGAVESIRLRLEDAGFRLDVSIPQGLPKVRVDGRAIQHCLLNLLDNAVKYSRERKEVRVSVGTRGTFVTLSVADRGVGIPPEDQERIFDKFARVDSGLVHDVKGTGLGLALVEMLVRAHHGHVEVVSTPGEGSTFTILLPIWEGDREHAV
jgi:signal transduction histidine kinase